jgi:phosphoribosylglycinamide formyltransferase-1
MIARRVPIAVFASGQGSNFEVLATQSQTGALPVEVRCLIVDKIGTRAVERAKRLHIPVLELSYSSFINKQQYEEYICQYLKATSVEWICLAGYMRLIGNTILSTFPHRIINIHPSLLPAFPGKDAIQRAWHKGVKVSGVTTHLVDAGIDTGPILKQLSYTIKPTDTLSIFEHEIHQLEHRIYPETLLSLFAN